MATPVEIENLVVTLSGNYKSYEAMLKKAPKLSDTMAKTIEGRLKKMEKQLLHSLLTPQERYTKAVRDFTTVGKKAGLSAGQMAKGYEQLRRTLPEVRKEQDRLNKSLAAANRFAHHGILGKGMTHRDLQQMKEFLTPRDYGAAAGMLYKPGAGMAGFAAHMQAARKKIEREEKMIARAGIERRRKVAAANKAFAREQAREVIALEKQIERAGIERRRRVAQADRMWHREQALTERSVLRNLGGGSRSEGIRGAFRAMRGMEANRARNNDRSEMFARADAIREENLTRIQRYNRELTNLHTLMRRGYLSTRDYVIASERLRNEFALTGRAAIRLGADVRNIGRNLSLYVSAPLLGIGALSVREFGKFDEAMTKSMAIMGREAKPFRAEMEGAIRELTTKSKFAPEELAKGYYYLASAGMNAKESIAALPIVERFAVAGSMELEHATDKLAESVTALGLRSTNMQKTMAGMRRVSDVLVEAANRSIGTVEQFTEALTNKAAASLKMVNKTVEEGVAILAAYSDRGIKAQHAGEYLSIAMRDLQQASIKHKDQWEKLGVAIFDASGKMRPFASIIRDLEHSFDGLTDSQKREQIMLLGFQARSVHAIQALFGMSDAIEKYEENFKTMGNVTERVAADQMEAFNNKVKVIQNRLKLMGIDIAQSLMPTIETFMGTMSKWITKWNNLGQTSKDTLVSLGGMLALMGPLTAGFGMLVGTGGRLFNVFTALGRAARSVDDLTLFGTARVWGARAGMVGMALAGSALAGTIVHELMPATQAYNRELERSLDLDQKIAQMRGERAAANRDKLAGMDDQAQRTSFIKAEIARLEKERQGLSIAQASAEKNYKEFNPDPNSAIQGGAARGLRNFLGIGKKDRETFLAEAKRHEEAIAGINKELKTYREELNKVVTKEKEQNQNKEQGNESLIAEDEALERINRIIEQNEDATAKYNRQLKELDDIWKTLGEKRFPGGVKAFEELQKKFKEDMEKHTEDKEAKRAKKELEAMRDRMAEKEATFGMSDAQARVKIAEMRGATPEELEELNVMAKHIDLMEEEAKKQKEINRVLKEAIDPQEEYLKKKAIFDEALKNGKIKAEEYAHALKKIRKELQEDQGKVNPNGGVAGPRSARAHGIQGIHQVSQERLQMIWVNRMLEQQGRGGSNSRLAWFRSRHERQRERWEINERKRRLMADGVIIPNGQDIRKINRADFGFGRLPEGRLEWFQQKHARDRARWQERERARRRARGENVDDVAKAGADMPGVAANDPAAMRAAVKGGLASGVGVETKQKQQEEKQLALLTKIEQHLRPKGGQQVVLRQANIANATV